MGISVLFGLALPALLSLEWPLLPHILGGVLVVLAIAVPQRLRTFYRIWMGMAHVLGAINSRVLLTIVYLLVVTPIGLIRRLAGADTMDRTFSKTGDSYRHPSETRNPDHVERPF